MVRVVSILKAGGARRLVVVGAVLIAATILGAALSLWDLRRSAITASRSNVAALDTVLTEELSRSIQSIDLVLGEAIQEVVHSGAITPAEFRQQMASEATHDFLAGRLKALPQGTCLFLTAALGVQVNSSNFWPIPAVALGDRDSFQAAADADRQSLLISTPVKSRVTGRWTLFLTRRIESRAGVFLGTVQATIELRYFEQFYQTIATLDGESVAVMNRDGVILVRHPQIERLIGARVPRESAWEAATAKGSDTFTSPGYLDSVPREVALRVLKDYPLVISVAVPETTALAPWYRQATVIGVGTTCAVVVFAALFLSLAAQFGRLERSERALSRALRRTERADRAKSDFLGRMSHELRTPLNAIIGFSEVLLGEIFGPLGTPRYKEYAEDILRSGRFLHDLISDMLDMVKIESGHRDLHLETFDFAGEIDEAMRMIRPRAELGQVRLEQVAGDAPAAIVADRRAFKQIVLNLIGNAVKFTPAGGTVSVRSGGSDGDALLQIADTGVGIAPANLAKLGTPFFRVEDNPHQASTEGTGLGIALTKSLIELHGWTVDFASVLGKGTTVTITMPDALRPAADAGRGGIAALAPTGAAPAPVG
ncbi:MAG TPA: ATP-binding protein [Stellaceae bacterium]|nr:ATP-binding protein [Stellaceae bacterium]